MIILAGVAGVAHAHYTITLRFAPLTHTEKFHTEGRI